MKISLNWLNDYIDVQKYKKDPEDLARRLTRAGIEVEGVEDLAKNFQNIKVGHIQELKPHPNADKLTLCQVDVGEKTLQPIVCGAKNHKKGDKVAVALPGAVLPGDFKIKKSKIRGEESHGMLCSEKELGLTTEPSEGILILPQEAPVGESFASYYNLDDVLMELSVTPNRADCLSHWGVARELSTLLAQECRLSKKELKKSDLSTLKTIELKVMEPDMCPRYAGRLIQNVKVGPSPQWLKTKLESVGLNSINNIVDVTNFILMELGQPLHAFDVSQLQGRKIVVDKSKKGEKFQTLDGTELTLTGEELMIRDGQRPVAMAGVIGGLNSGVTESTTDLFIESAYFSQKTVRRSSRHFGIETDSAYRFARGTDPEGVIKALNRACEWIQELAGGEVAQDYYDEYPHPIHKKSIPISREFVEKKMGYTVQAQDFVNWMSRLGCEVEGDEKQWWVKAPAFRWDLNDDVDLVEEYARLYGYENIPEILPPLNHEPTLQEKSFFQSQEVQKQMVGLGYSQAMNYHFISSRWTEEFLEDRSQWALLGVPTPDSLVALKNPLNEELNGMRVSLLPGLYQNLQHNYRYAQSPGRLFELGHVFAASENTEVPFTESMRLSLMAWGDKESLWQKTTPIPMVFQLKSDLENLLNTLGVSQWEWRAPEGLAPAMVHPGQWATLFLEGKNMGFIGALHPKWSEAHKIRVPVALAELNFDLLMKNDPRKRKFKVPSRFPAVERDLAFLVPKDLTAEAVQKEITKVAKPYLQSIFVFDLYEGENLPEGFKSMAFKLLLQNEDKTWEEKELQQLQEKIIQKVKSSLGVDVR